METKVAVPEGMLNAAKRGIRYVSHQGGSSTLSDGQLEQALLFVCRWIAEQAPKPTQSQANTLAEQYHGEPPYGCATQYAISEWQRRMFLAPEPEAPEAIKDLMTTETDKRDGLTWTNDGHDNAVLKAYRRGQAQGNAAQK